MGASEMHSIWVGDTKEKMFVTLASGPLLQHFFLHDSQTGPLSQSVCPWQAFPA
jgi:hypothetical protein